MAFTVLGYTRAQLSGYAGEFSPMPQQAVFVNRNGLAQNDRFPMMNSISHPERRPLLFWGDEGKILFPPPPQPPLPEPQGTSAWQPGFCIWCIGW